LFILIARLQQPVGGGMILKRSWPGDGDVLAALPAAAAQGAREPMRAGRVPASIVYGQVR